MKTFKEYIATLDDTLDLNSRFMYHWHDKWVFKTKHALDRIKERLKGDVIDKLKTLFKNAIDKAVSVGEYLFYSKSLDQGFIGSVDNRGNITAITVLPPGKSFPKDGTDKIIVEDKEYQIIER